MTSDISSWRWERLKIFSAIPPAILPKQTQGGRTFIFVIYSKRSVSKRIHLWLLSQSINRPGFRIRYLLYLHIMLLFRGSTLFLQMQLLTLLNYFLLTLPYFIYQNFDNAKQKKKWLQKKRPRTINSLYNHISQTTPKRPLSASLNSLACLPPIALLST